MIIFQKGEVFAGRFRLEDRIGQGGMGQVWRAVQLGLNRQVAVKIILPQVGDDDRFRAMFLQEAQISGSLSHPNIVPVVDFGESEGGILWLVQIFVKGQDLGDVLERARGGVPVPLATHIVSQILLALQCAHDQGVIHRDLKPGNVLVSDAGDILITDFGIAKVVAVDQTPSVSTALKGSPGYLAPELLKGFAPTFACDLFSVGGLLWELLTGRNPFVRTPHADREQIFFATLNEDPPSLNSLGIAAPPGLDELVHKLLQKDPLKRHQTASLALEELLTVCAPLAREATSVALRRYLATTKDTFVSAKAATSPMPGAALPPQPVPGTLGVSAMAGQMAPPRQSVPSAARVPAPKRRTRRKRALGVASTLVALAGLGIGIAASRSRWNPKGPPAVAAAKPTPVAEAVPPPPDAGMAAPAKRGRLAVRIEPTDAEVSVDGKRLAPPLEAADLAIGAIITVRGQHEGFEPAEKIVSIQEDTQVVLALQRTPDAGPKPTEPPPKKEPARKQQPPKTSDKGSGEVLPI